MTNTRYLAARIINDVTDGHSLSDCLEASLSTLKDPRDRAFVQAVCYGVCRFYPRLDVILSYLLKKPMNARDGDAHALLLVGLFQLMEMRVPPHAAVAETVEATEKLKKPWARGLTNAILREYLREREQLKEKISTDSEAVYAHPDWWIAAIKKAWPNQWEKILAANNEHPPFALRVNAQQLTRESYMEKLVENDMLAQIIPETESGIILLTPVPTESLPGFAAGSVSVQDGAAQLAGELLDLAPHLHILDACAAPGGKLTQMLELEPESSIIAVEKEPKRIASIKENLVRLQIEAECICADVLDTKKWWDGRPFDRILLDAPCSASGVIRRHPDIKLLRQESDIPRLAKEQLQLLHALWPLLKPEGVLLYVTCSIFPEENTLVIQKFMDQNKEASEVPIPDDWGVACKIGRQILPGMHNMDGFYYARLQKASA